MTMNMVAMIINAGICIVIPIVILGLLFFKNPMERKGMILSFFLGIIVYLVTQWGIKEQGLKYLFNHTEFMQFMEGYYISYLFVVALAGAVFAVVPEVLIIVFLFKKQMSFRKAAVLGLGYTMAESIMLVGYRSIITIVELVKTPEAELSSTTVELFLSGYERLLLMLIQVTLIVVLVYFIEQKMAVRGTVIKVFCHTLVAFLPGLFIAFSLTNYYEVYDRTMALVLVYILLTAAAFSSWIVLNSLKYSLKDDRIDSPKAVAAYRKKTEEKQKKKEEKRQKRIEKKIKGKKAMTTEVMEGEEK